MYTQEMCEINDDDNDDDNDYNDNIKRAKHFHYYLYCFLKLHKTPIKHSFVSGFNKYSTKDISCLQPLELNL